jgi:hypothetical protein
MFNRAYFLPATKDFSLDVIPFSREGSAIERFVRDNHHEVSVLRGAGRISERQIEALHASNKFVIAIGDGTHLTTIREVACLESARSVGQRPFGLRHFDLLFLAIPESKRAEFVGLLDSLKDLSHNVRRIDSDSCMSGVMTPLPESSVFRFTETDSSVLVEFLKPQSEWEADDFRQYENELKSILQSMIPPADWERVDGGSFFIDSERMAHVIQARADFISEFKLSDFAQAIYIDVRDGDRPVLCCPAQEGMHYPLFYKGLEVELKRPQA